MLESTQWGVVAGIVSLVGFILYAYSQLRGGTRPNRASWLVWTALGFSLAASSYLAGEREAMWVYLVQFVGPAAVAIIAIWRGEGGWSRLDRFCIAGAAAGLAVMWLSPGVAIAACVLVDSAGAIPTIKKASERPASENRLAWTISFIANLINLLAISKWSFEVATYPLYLLGLTGVMVTLLTIRHRTPKLRPAT